MTPNDRHIGRRIRGKRRALGLSEDFLARQLGIEARQIEAYERGMSASRPNISSD